MRGKRPRWGMYPMFVLAVAGIITLVFLVAGAMVFVAFRLGVLPADRNPGVFMLLTFLAPCLVVGIALATVFGRGMMGPVDRLITAMRRVAKGDFDVRLPESDRGPFGDINHDFNEMVTRLSQTEMLREDFVASVSHEFKSPLATISGYATLLQDEGLAQGERAEYAAQILWATRSLSSLSGNILELSSLDVADGLPQAGRVSLDEQLRHVVTGFLPRWDAKGIDFDLDLAKVEVVGNEGMLDEVWENLLSNATKFTDAGGKVTVTLVREGTDAVVRVTDTGCGMDEATAARAFDKFYQGDSSHASEGAGLGLALARRIVELHGGGIAVDSAPGRGTTFEVRLPIARAS